MEALIARLLAKQPGERFASAAEVARLLKPLAKGHDLIGLLRRAERQKPASRQTSRKDAANIETDDLITPTIASPVNSAAATMVCPPTALARSGGARASRSTPSYRTVALAASALLLVGVLAAQIIVTIRGQDGKEKQVALKPGSELKVDADTGEVTVVPKPAIRSAEIASGDPLSPAALVDQPATIEGIESWTIETIAPRGYIIAAAFRPDGKQLATLGVDQTIRLWNVETGKLERAFVTPQGQTHGRAHQSLAYSADGQRLAFATKDIRVWNVQTGRLVMAAREANGGDAGNVAISPDGKLIATAFGNVRLWDVTNGRQLDLFPLEQMGHSYPALPMFSPDGKRLAVYFRDTSGAGILEIWDPQTGKKLKRLSFEDEYLGAPVYRPMLAWSPNGDRLAFSGGLTLQIWDTKSWEIKQKVKTTQNGIFGLAWNSDGTQIAIGHEWFNAQTGKPEKSLPATETLHSVLARSPDGSRELATDALADPRSQSQLVIRDSQTGKVLRELPKIHGSASQGHETFAWLDNTRCVWMGKVWNTAQGAFEGTLKEQDKPRLDMRMLAWGQLTSVVSPDGTHFYETTPKGILIRNLSDPNAEVLLEKTSEGTDPNRWEPVTWSLNGKRMAVICKDTFLRIWDTQTGRLICSPPASYIIMAAFSPDGRILATAQGHQGVYLWDATTGEKRQTLATVPNLEGSALFWSDNGKRVAWIHGRARTVFDAQTGKKIEETPSVGDGGYGTAAPDGRLYAFILGTHARRFWQSEGNRDLGLVILLNRDQTLKISPNGHYDGSPRVERELIYVVKTATGQDTYSPADFAEKFHWQNDPAQTRIEPAPRGK